MYITKPRHWAEQTKGYQDEKARVAPPSAFVGGLSNNRRACAGTAVPTAPEAAGLLSARTRAATRRRVPAWRHQTGAPDKGPIGHQSTPVLWPRRATSGRPGKQRLVSRHIARSRPMRFFILLGAALAWASAAEAAESACDKARAPLCLG